LPSTRAQPDATAAGGAEAAQPSERRAASWMAVGTLLSRLTGFVRTAALVAVLGITELGDAYNTANTIPNMLLVLVTGGTLSSVLIPMLARTSDEQTRRHRAETIGGLVVVSTGLASLLTMVAAPLIARAFALGVSDEAHYGEFIAVTSRWLVLFGPQILLYGISVYAQAVLNAHGRLALVGFAPVATNIVAIASVVAYMMVGGPRPPSLGALGTVPLLVLGVGTTLSIAAMALPQLLGAKRVLPGLRLRPRLRLRDPAAKELWRLGRWTLGYVAANQAGLAVVIALANTVAGGVIAYQTAFAIMQLPFGIVAVSLFSAIYPRLSRTAAERDGGFAAAVAGGLRLALALLVPAAVGLFALAEPVAELLVGYGAARGEGAAFVGAALRVFAIALLPFTVFQLLTRSYYALTDTRTPMLANIVVNVVNVLTALTVFAVVADPRARISGLVASYATSYLVGCVLLGSGLVRQRPGAFRGGVRAAVTAGAAAVLMFVLLTVGHRWLPGAGGAAWPLLRTGGLIAAGAVVYVAGLALFRNRELREIVQVRRSAR
jgi:putative peptidoglycan lipid II flippase